MRFTHILVACAALIMAAACSFSDIDDVNSTPGHASQYLQVVGRVAQYSDCDVATRSKKEGDEPKVTSMGLALFPIENGAIGNCLYYDFELGGSIVFIVDRHDAIFNNYTDKQFAMYIFANMQDSADFPQTAEEGVGKSLEYFTTCAVAANANVDDVPANGFPMMGSLGNTISTQDADGIELILKPTQTANNTDGLPLVGGTPTDNLEIPLKSVYAKFSFTISVKPDQEIVGNKAPRFDLLSYEVNNIAATVDANSSTNDDTAVIASSGEVSMGNYAQGATTAKFDFYLPERYLSPSKSINDVLPDELKSASADEREKYRQRYKNKLVDGKAATYVTITGKYTDHQGHVYDVDYNIYLGENNYDDFNIIRNTHYDNSVTIRGISASTDQSVEEDGVSIDWRVNVKRSTPLVINLRRESLLDAHYEVRPMRLRLVGEDVPTGTSATVQILDEKGTTNNIPAWIRLELSGNTANHITTEGSSKGKRKYFTTDLLSNTLSASTSVTVNNLTRDNQTVWIYVDENTSTVSRTAIVRVSYAGVDKDYKIVQHGLHKVTGADSGKDYYIEQYEEYLYNYDAEDSYGQTRDEGMPWGLNGKQLSYKYRSFQLSESNDDWTEFVKNTLLPTYDFYIEKHDGFAKTNGADKVHNHAGHEFTKEIAKNVKILTMAEGASGAVEYCYNRNKRQADGTIKEEDLVWYLPSADELEDFIITAYGTFKEFQDNYYWTSQPAYIKNIFYYEYKEWSWSSFKYITTTSATPMYIDNTEYARATKVTRVDGGYDYVTSGLMTEPYNFVPRTETGYTNLGCFYEMPRWKNGTYDIATKSTADNNSNPPKVIGSRNGDERYTDTKNGDAKYFVHLGHLYDLIETKNGEHGYHERTKSNRVRCVRKM
ncbi:MAG: DUF4906 domain-containing protein [Alistipes sp.]|nr:DUF4906 domain-containing protein [Alistipes sp.]